MFIRHLPCALYYNKGCAGYTGEFSPMSGLQEFVFLSGKTHKQLCVKLSETILIAGSRVLVCDSEHLDLVTTQHDKYLSTVWTKFSGSIQKATNSTGRIRGNFTTDQLVGSWCNYGIFSNWRRWRTAFKANWKTWANVQKWVGPSTREESKRKGKNPLRWMLQNDKSLVVESLECRGEEC